MSGARRGVTVAVLAAVALASEPARAEEGAPAPSPKPDAAAAGHDDRDDDTGAFRFGVLGGVGFPRPLALEGFVALKRTLLLGVEYSALPTVRVAGVDARSWAAAGDARVFPFGGAFFVGLRAGFQRVATEGSVSVAGLGSYAETSTVDAWFLNPRVGFLFVVEPFAIGLDAGLQIPVNATTTRTSTVDLAAYGVESPVASATDTLGRSVLPTVDLLRVGLVF